MKRTLASLAAMVAVGVVAGYASTPVFAQDKAGSTYVKERADCDAGRTAEDRATCLKEAGAAAQERKRNTLDNSGSMRQNAVDRCNALPQKDRADCLARIEGPNKANQVTTTSGSVAGGGVIRETTTTTVGQPTIIIVPAAPTPVPVTPATPATPPKTQ